MTTPDRDGTVATYGGPWFNAAPVVDPTRDAPDFGFNQALESLAQMTMTCPRCVCRITWNGTSAPTLVSHMAMWGNLPGVAPVPSRLGVGSGLITWPTTVQDSIQIGQPGYNPSGHTVGLLYARGDAEGTTYVKVQATGGGTNLVTFALLNTAGSAFDPSGVNLVIFGY